MAVIGSFTLTATDEDAFTERLEQIMTLADSAADHGGSYLVKGGNVETVAGGSNPDRVMIVEFEHVGQARSWLSSPEFAEFSELAGSCADVQAMILEGL